jgi:hypothetical protein
VVILGFLTLREEVRSEDYETWLREIDYPVATSLPSTRDMKVFRIDAVGKLPSALTAPKEDAPCQYVEVIEVTNLDQLAVDVRTPAMREIFRGFQGFVETSLFAAVERIV